MMVRCGGCGVKGGVEGEGVVWRVRLWRGG